MMMTAVNGLTSAAYSAVEGIHRAVRTVEAGAQEVAAGTAGGPGEPAFSRQMQALHSIKAAGRQARANAAVSEAVDDLSRDLLRLNRR